MRKLGIKISWFIVCVLIYSGAFGADIGSISGIINWDGGYGAISGAVIYLYDLDGATMDSAFSNTEGKFRLDMVAGEYIISAEKNNFVKEYFPGEYLMKEADKIVVFAGQNVNIDFKLNSGGWISGTFAFAGDDVDFGLVTAIKIDEPQEGLYKSLYLNGPFPSAYAICGLLPGTYKILGRARGKSTEYYPGVSEISQATAISVIKDLGVSDISFMLNQAGWGTIQGRVIDQALGQGIPDIPLFAYQWKNFWEDPNLINLRTDLNGEFIIRLPAGDYFLFALYPDILHGGDPIPIYYNNCYDPTNADIIPVDANQAVEGIDFAIDYSVSHSFSISGTVLSQQSGRGLDDIVVTAIDFQSGEVAGSAYSANEGEYSINDLAPGRYLLMFSGAFIIPYFYPQVENWQDGEVIILQGHFGNVRTEAITQDYGNNSLAIIGTVTSGNNPIEGARVYAFPDGQDDAIAYARTDAAGQYTIISGLVPGSYQVMCDYWGYNFEYFPSQISLDLMTNPVADNVNFHLSLAMTSIQSNWAPAMPVEISGNYPNPFNSNTLIRVVSGQDHEIQSVISVYDILGHLVGKKPVSINPGLNNIAWGVGDFQKKITSGIYYYRLEGFGQTNRMIFLK